MRQLTFSQFSEKIADSTFILSMREAFISLVPYVVVSATIVLILGLIDSYALLNHNNYSYQALAFVSATTHGLFPLAVVIAISYYLSQNIGLNSLTGVLLAVICFFTSSNYITSITAEAKITLNTNGAIAYAIIIPTITSYLMAYLSRQKIFNRLESRLVSVFLIKQINFIFPFLIIFIFLFTTLPFLADLISWIMDNIANNTNKKTIEASYLTYNFSTHLFWFLGIHGENITLSILNTDFYFQYILPNLTTHNFNDTFVTLGGAGSIWGLIIAIAIASRDEHLNQIVKISLPFSAFNISEIIMYGIPVVLNPYFLIPFLICPLLNFGLSYIAIDYGLIIVTNTQVSWMTPILMSGYLISDGSLSTVLYQALLVSINALIYIPFVKMYSAANSKLFMFNQLSNKLSISSEIESHAEKRHFNEQGKSLTTHRQLRQTIDNITNGELLMHYQPKMDTNGLCYGFEALLRLKQKDGRIVGPYFLNGLEKAGFADAVDWWVIDKVADDIQLWQQQAFKPNISVNLNPYVLKEDSLIKRIIKNFSSFQGQVEVEILETAYIKNFLKIRENINRLKHAGINTAIDDFGTGFSSLSLLYKLNADTIKIDKSILDNAESEKGIVLYKQLCNLCKQLGFRLVAEGVETAEQCEFVTSAGVDYIQGWYYAAAMPHEKAMSYALRNNAAVTAKNSIKAV